ncbi:MAG: DUF3352 domain-containing protein [Alkalinema sp. RU_4_3]|nr:DUF3352 domain-containing protein [Alkalinema sp. RU_4_3]
MLGLSAFGWLWSHSPLALLKGATHPNPEAIIFVSKQAPLMASLQGESDRLIALAAAVAKPGDRTRTRQSLQQLRDGLLGEGLNYDKDVKPWLGEEVTAAITSSDFDRDDSNGKKGGYLLALTTKNALASREFLQRFWQARSTDQAFTFEQYKGTELIYGTVDQDKPTPLNLASAVVGDRFLLFANSPNVLKNAINNVQASELNLSQSPDYQKAIAALPNNRLGLVYSNLPQLANLIGDSKALDNVSLEAIQAVALGLGANRQGLVAHSAILDSSPSQTATASSNALLKYLPEGASIALSSQNLNQFWTRLTQETQGYALAETLLPNTLKTWETTWGLNLPEDLFSWVTGDYALGLLPGAKQTDWIFAASRTSTTNLDKLDQVAKQKGLTLVQESLGDRTISLWKNKDAVAGAWASEGNAIVFASSLEALTAGLKNASIAQTPGFAGAMGSVNSANNGVAYIDWAKAKPWLEQQFPIVRTLEFVAQPLFGRLKQVTVTSYGGGEGIETGDVVLGLE